MKALKLAPTISTPGIEELPRQESFLEMLEKRKRAKIVEGYTFMHNTSEEFPHKVSAEVNIDNDRLWEVIKALVIKFPSEVALIYHHIDDMPKYGCYVDKFELLDFLNEYKTELCEDGYLEFGIIGHTPELLEEIFIKKAKYLQYWGMSEIFFKETMNSFQLYPVENLNFIDEYPLKTEALSLHKSDVVRTDELLKIFENEFGDEQLT